jgi:hypothetical protein
MLEDVVDRAEAARGKTRKHPAVAFRDRAIGRLDMRDQVFEKGGLHRFVVAVGLPVVHAAGHDDEHQRYVAFGDQLVEGRNYVALSDPLLFVHVGAVQQIEDRIVAIAGFVPSGQIDNIGKSRPRASDVNSDFDAFSAARAAGSSAKPVTIAVKFMLSSFRVGPLVRRRWRVAEVGRC